MTTTNTPRRRNRPRAALALAIAGLIIAMIVFSIRVVSFANSLNERERLQHEQHQLEERARCLQRLTDVPTLDLDLCEVEHP